MTFDFSIRAWSAYATGLTSRTDWLTWTTQPALPAGEPTPELAELPASRRRRLGPLGRMAAQVGFWCQEVAGDMPVVFVSRYGEAERSLALLLEQAAGNSLSPTAFGLSVHNAIGAQYSIARADRGNYLALSGGAGSALHGVFEALSLLADGADAVMVICYDAPLPGAYAVFADEPVCHYAWAWVVCKPPLLPTPGVRYRIEPGALGPLSATSSPAVLPYGLDVLRFVLSDDASMKRAVDGCAWEWQRHV